MDTQQNITDASVRDGVVTNVPPQTKTFDSRNRNVPLTGAQSALREANKNSNLSLNDPRTAAKKQQSAVHEKARMQQNYENMRKMLSQKKTGGKSDPFEEDDVGKRFQLLKAQMNVQENDSQEAINQSALSNITDSQPGDPAGPVSGSM